MAGALEAFPLMGVETGLHMRPRGPVASPELRGAVEDMRAAAEPATVEPVAPRPPATAAPTPEAPIATPTSGEGAVPTVTVRPPAERAPAPPLTAENAALAELEPEVHGAEADTTLRQIATGESAAPSPVPTEEAPPQAGEERVTGALPSAPEQVAPPRPERPQRRPVDAVTALIDAGGVRDPGGDLRAMGADAVHHRAAGRLINNRSGMPPDTAREFLRDRGYLPQDADINSVHDVIAEHIAGRPTFTAEDAAEAEGWRQGQMATAERDRYDREVFQNQTIAAEAGIRLTPEALDHSAQLSMEGYHPEEAVMLAARASEAERGLYARRLPQPPAAGAPLFGEAARAPAPRREAEPTIRNDERQAVMPGMEPSARQAQAARDQAGPRGGQQMKGCSLPRSRSNAGCWLAERSKRNNLAAQLRSHRRSAITARSTLARPIWTRWQKCRRSFAGRPRRTATREAS